MTHPSGPAGTGPGGSAGTAPPKLAVIFAVGVAIGFGLVRRLTRKATVR